MSKFPKISNLEKNVFPDHLIVEPQPDGRTWKLTRRFRVRLHGLIVISIPEGFIMDFASIPRFLWRVLPPWDKHLRAAAVHDYLYRTPDSGIKTRKEADMIFLKLMKILKVGYFKRWTMYLGVRAFGGQFFRAGDR